MREVRRFTSYSAIVTMCVMVVSQLPATPGRAQQLLDQLKGATGAGQSGTSGAMAGALGAGGLPSLGHAGTSNTAGVLQYCIQNKYLGGGSASSVKDGLMSKVTGSGKSTSDSGFQNGSHGMLETGNGQNFSLGGMKSQMTQKVCDQVLQHGKSLL